MKVFDVAIFVWMHEVERACVNELARFIACREVE
jgi:hypothetical protein